MVARSELRSIVGETWVRDAEDADAIDGVAARAVVAPGSVEEVSAVMGLAHREGWCVAPRGGGTRLGLGNPPEGLELILDITRLDRILEHAAGDLVVAVEPGVRIEALQAQLAGAGQMLALDGYAKNATIGGTIAANTYGPRRLRYGTVRDLLIGLTVVLHDGTIAKSGGKVVKNVAGYDLGKLMTGSLGTLGVIVKAIFRLHPRPRAQRLVEAEFSTVDQVQAAAQRLIHSILVPSAIQLSWPPERGARVGVLLEGVEPSVLSQAATAVALFGADSHSRIWDDPESIGARWAKVISSPEGIDMELKVTCLPNAIGETIRIVKDAARQRLDGCHLTASLGSGIINVFPLGGGAEAKIALVSDLRSRVRTGSVTVVNAPPEVKKQIDVWGPVGDAEGLMRRVKDRFDPHHLLNRGRFAGGI